MSSSIKRKTPKKRSLSKKSRRTRNSRGKRSPRKNKSPIHRTRSPRSSRKSKSKSVGGWMDPSKFKKNSLGKYGYKTSLAINQRHAALEKAVKAYGAHSVWSKLNAVSILNKNRSPKTANIFTTDKNWVKRKFVK